MPSAAARGPESAARMLAEAEQWATLASLVGGQYPYALFQQAGEQLDASPTTAYDLCEQIRGMSLAHLASHMRTEGEGRPLIVFNGLAMPRSDLVRFRTEWPDPGTNAVAVIDMWDRRVPTAVDEVVRHAGGSLAVASLHFVALDVPSVGYRAYRLIAQPWEDLTSDFQPPAAVIDAEHPLVAILADRHPGHLPPAGGLVQIDPAGDVELVSLALNADGAVVMRLRETGGRRRRRVEIRLFVDVPSGPLRVDLGAGQTATVTAVAEPAPWAPRGPLLGPPLS